MVTGSIHSLCQELRNVIAAISDDIIFKGVIVHDLNFEHGISAERDGEEHAIVPMWIFTSTLASLRTLVLSTDINFAVRILNECR